MDKLGTTKSDGMIGTHVVIMTSRRIFLQAGWTALKTSPVIFRLAFKATEVKPLALPFLMFSYAAANPSGLFRATDQGRS